MHPKYVWPYRWKIVCGCGAEYEFRDRDLLWTVANAAIKHDAHDCTVEDLKWMILPE